MRAGCEAGRSGALDRATHLSASARCVLRPRAHGVHPVRVCGGGGGGRGGGGAASEWSPVEEGGSEAGRTVFGRLDEELVEGAAARR